MSKHGSRLDDAIGVLLSDACADIVDLVLCARGGVVEAHARAGAVGFTKDGVVWERGRNPLDRQDTAAFSPLPDEMANVRPSTERNHYPHAYDNAAHLFDDPREKAVRDACYACIAELTGNKRVA